MTTSLTPTSEAFAPQFHAFDPTHLHTHELPLWPDCFAAVRAGQKPFDVRRNHEDFQVGDVLLLREFSPEANEYTGRTITRWVSYVLQGGNFGVEPDWCVLGFSSQPPIPAGMTDIRLW